MSEGNSNEQCSFGIKKIVDCKIDEGGKQLYKVKWEATWEPAENLSSCQHLIDEFWGFVNKAKSNEDTAQQCRKKIRLDHGQNNGSMNFGAHALSEDSKDEVQRLIARTNATQPGNSAPSLMTPSELLNTQQNHMGMPRTPTRAPQSPFSQNTHMPFAQSPNHFGQQQQQNFGSPQPNFGSSAQMNSPSSRGKAPGFGKPSAASVKNEQDDSDPPVPMTTLTSQQEEIAEVVYICKNCKKPLSKHKSTWRRHYQSCAKEFKYICHVCSKGFTMKFRMEQHVQQKHAGGVDSEDSKPNTPNEVKKEDFSTPAAAAGATQTGVARLPNNISQQQLHPHPTHHQQEEMVLPKPIQNGMADATTAMMMLSNTHHHQHHHHHHHPSLENQFLLPPNYVTGSMGGTGVPFGGGPPAQPKMESFDRVFAGIR